MTDVTLVTKSATLDDLSLSDYADMFDELRHIDPLTNKRLSLDKFVAMVTSKFSKATWSKFEHGEPVLNRQMKSELRVACGLDPLPLTVEAAVAIADPDAAVWTVGDDTPGTVILVGAAPVTLHINGAVTVVPERVVTSVTRIRPPVVRPVASKQQDARRVAVKRTWNEIIELGLKAAEELDG